MNAKGVRDILRPLIGTFVTGHVWPIGDERLLAVNGRWVYLSSDRGRRWRVVHELPPSTGPMGVLPTACAQRNGQVYLAEYPLGDEPARILVSDDRGETWSTAVTEGRIRHFHGIFHDPYGDRLWATAGDTDQESAIGIVEDGAFRPVVHGSQRFRAVDLAFTPDAVIWGVDCSFATGNDIYRLTREQIPGSSPKPEQVGRTDASIFYAETVEVDGTPWVVLSTAAETGIDSTAPRTERENRGANRARVLAASRRSGYRNWQELHTFRRRQTLGDRHGRVPSAGAYVFIDTAGDELLVNPFNTASDHGRIITTSCDQLESVRERPAVATTA